MILTLARLGGGVKSPPPPGTKLNISTWKWASKTTTLLDFLHFNLTNPMVPNLSNEFLSGWVSGTVSRGVYYVLGQKWLFLNVLSNITFCPKSVGHKVIELRTGLGALPLQPYVNGRGGGGPSARKFNVSRLGLYSLWSSGLGLGWWTRLVQD